MDDLERYEPTPGSDLARFVKRARERGVDAHALRPKLGTDGRRRVTLLHGVRIVDDIPQDGNEDLRGRGFEIIPEDELPEGTTRITFFGAPRRVPEVGERVEVRIEDGSWRGGFRATGEPTTDEAYPGERVIWISREEEWQAATREDREPAGAPWPLEQMAAVGE